MEQAGDYSYPSSKKMDPVSMIDVTDNELITESLAASAPSGGQDPTPGVARYGHISGQSVDTSIFPTTRYYGSKRQLLPWLDSIFSTLNFDSVLDAFGGTASVSLLLRGKGKNVTFNDGLRCNTIGAKAVLGGPYSDDFIDQAKGFVRSVTPSRGIITEEFSTLYYTDKENMWIDGFMASLESISDGPMKNALMYALFQACLQKRPFNLFHRANLNIRQRRAERRTTKFGNATTWETCFCVLAERALDQLLRVNWIQGPPATICDAGDALEIGSQHDLVYIDPPYVPRERYADDYGRLYHFIEGLTFYGEWPSHINRNLATKALFPTSHLRSWSQKKGWHDRLSRFLDRHKRSTVVMSYVDGAYPDIRELADMFSNIFGHVDIEIKPYRHALARGEKREIVLISG